MSISGETFASWATHVTRCSNPTFNRVVDRLWPNPSLQKNVLAVLSGITKTIQDRNGKESGSEYYAVLVSDSSISVKILAKFTKHRIKHKDSRSLSFTACCFQSVSYR